MTAASDDPLANSATVPGSAGQASVSRSPTRGFLFADLRDYTRYVEGHGAADAADLLVRYRTIVRQAVAEHDGAEIKTEGDSFYVVFPAVSTAVLCGLAIVAGSGVHEAADGRAQVPIPVGVGIHAGETVETPDGYVGTPVNIAARICAIARPGEVLVSDTVRSLTQTVLPVSFESRGRQKLKGVTDPVAVFAVAASADAWAGSTARRHRRRRLLSVALVVSFVLVAGALAWYLSRPSGGLPPGPWKIGVVLSLSGDGEQYGVPMRDAVQLAMDSVAAGGGIGGVAITLDVLDDVVRGDTPQGPNAAALVADPRVIAMIGPVYSSFARFDLPLTNEAGLLQCSGSDTGPFLTKPREGALDLRAAHPDRINFVRTVPTDDTSAAALASFILRDLKVHTTLVVDLEGFPLGDWFTDEYEGIGGSVVRMALNPGAEPQTVLGPLSDAADPPGAVVFPGRADLAVPLRQAMTAGGFGDLPFLSWDSLDDGSGAKDGSYIQLAGASAAGTYRGHITVAPAKAEFSAAFEAAYGSSPGDYEGGSYACVEVIMQALRAIAPSGPSADTLREALRSYVADPSHQYETVIGPVSFDANGDSTRQYATIYRVEPSAAGGKGDWVIAKQQDYGPPR